jgi:hypothetical protein
MSLIIDIAIRGLIIGLIGASISLMTSIVNGVGIAGGWMLAIAVFLVIFTIVFIVLVKETWDEYYWLNKNGGILFRYPKDGRRTHKEITLPTGVTMSYHLGGYSYLPTVKPPQTHTVTAGVLLCLRLYTSGNKKAPIRGSQGLVRAQPIRRSDKS